MKNKMYRQKTQRGITLLEITLVTLLVGVVSYIIFNFVGGDDIDRSKARSLVQHMRVVAKGVSGQQDLLGCYPLTHQAIFELEDSGGLAIGTGFGQQLSGDVRNNNTCDVTADQVVGWAGPYVKGMSFDGDGIVLDTIQNGVRGVIKSVKAKNSVRSGGTDILYYELSVDGSLGSTARSLCNFGETLPDVADTTINDECVNVGDGKPAIRIGAYNAIVD